MTRAQVLKNALELDSVEQELLLADLNERIYGEEGRPLTEEWRAEIHRRAEELRAGTATGIPSAEVHRNAREILAKQRSSQ